MESAVYVFIAPTVKHRKNEEQDVVTIFVCFPLLCPCIHLILTAEGNASDRHYKLILRCIITYFTVRRNGSEGDNKVK